MNPRLWFAFMLGLSLFGLTACGKPQDFAEADNARLLAQPTATAAAIKNDGAALYAATVVPARAAADAKSILARTDLQIKQNTARQELQHVGEMAVLQVSNTLRLNEIAEAHESTVQGIRADGARQQAAAQVIVADAAAQAEERAAQARMVTGLSIGAVIFLIVVGAGGALAMNKALDNRATIIDRTPDGSIKAIIKHGQIVYDSALGMGPITAAAGPSWLERLLLLLAMWQQMNRAGEHTSPWQVYREYKQITAPALAHPLPASEEAAVLIAQGAQQARVDAIAAKHKQAPHSTAGSLKAAEAGTVAAPSGAPAGLVHPAFQQPLPKLEILDVIDSETMRTLELVTGQA